MLLCVQTNESTHDSWWIWCQFGWVKGFAHSCKPRFHMCPSGCFQNRSELQSVDTVKWFATEAHVGKHQPPRCGAVWALFEAVQLGLSPPHYYTGTTPRYWRLKGISHHSEGSGMLGSPQCLYSSQGLDQKMLLLSNLAYSQKVILKIFHLVFPFYQSRVLLCDVSKISYQFIKDR